MCLQVPRSYTGPDELSLPYNAAVRRGDAWAAFKRQLGAMIMRGPGVLPINFTISTLAKQEIENLRQVWSANSVDKAAVAVIAWALAQNNAGRQWEGVAISFYGEAQVAEIAHGIQDASGLPVVLFTIPEYHSRFEGKVVDHSAKQRFFLRDPES